MASLCAQTARWICRLWDGKTPPGIPNAGEVEVALGVWYNDVDEFCAEDGVGRGCQVVAEIDKGAGVELDEPCTADDDVAAAQL